VASARGGGPPPQASTNSGTHAGNPPSVPLNIKPSGSCSSRTQAATAQVPYIRHSPQLTSGTHHSSHQAHTTAQVPYIRHSPQPQSQQQRPPRPNVPLPPRAAQHHQQAGQYASTATSGYSRSSITGPSYQSCKPKLSQLLDLEEEGEGEEGSGETNSHGAPLPLPPPPLPQQQSRNVPPSFVHSSSQQPLPNPHLQQYSRLLESSSSGGSCEGDRHGKDAADSYPGQGWAGMAADVRVEGGQSSASHISIPTASRAQTQGTSAAQEITAVSAVIGV